MSVIPHQTHKYLKAQRDFKTQQSSKGQSLQKQYKQQRQTQQRKRTPQRYPIYASKQYQSQSPCFASKKHSKQAEKATECCADYDFMDDTDIAYGYCDELKKTHGAHDLDWQFFCESEYKKRMHAVWKLESVLNEACSKRQWEAAIISVGTGSQWWQLIGPKKIYSRHKQLKTHQEPYLYSSALSAKDFGDFLYLNFERGDESFGSLYNQRNKKIHEGVSYNVNEYGNMFFFKADLYSTEMHCLSHALANCKNVYFLCGVNETFCEDMIREFYDHFGNRAKGAWYLHGEYNTKRNQHTIKQKKKRL